MRIAIIILALAASAPSFAEDVPCPYSVSPHVINGIGLVNGDPTFLIFTRLFPGQNEDRTVAEFDITPFKGNIEHMSLAVEVSNSNQGGDIGEVFLHTYIGDGIIVPSEFWAGSFHSSIQMDGPEHRAYIYFDVTSFILDASSAGETYVGFRLSAITDWYWVYDVFLRCDVGTPNNSMSWGYIKKLAR